MCMVVKICNNQGKFLSCQMLIEMGTDLLKRDTLEIENIATCVL